MPRTPKTRESGVDGFDDLELLSIVCGCFCDGEPPARIPKRVEKELEIHLRREDPWELLRYAGKHGWFHYSPPFEMEMSNRIRDRYGLEVDVVRSATSDDVSRRGASQLLRFLKKRAKKGQKCIHIGFAGGRALKRTAQILADLLERETDLLPPEIVFHAMVAGFDIKNPSTDPNAFFSYFDADTMPVSVSFIGLPAPALLNRSDLKTLSEIPPIEEALRFKSELDIVVTSAGGHWQDHHSGLSRAYQELTSQVDFRGCIGDLMWQPLGGDGPIDVAPNTPRALTLLGLNELSGFIAEGLTVLLLLGPCGQCTQPKTEVLRAILGCQPGIVTDLILDSRTARQLLASTH